MDNGDPTNNDDLTPPEYSIANILNRDGCMALANMTFKRHENTRKLEELRHQIAADPRPLGREGWLRIADAVDAGGVDDIHAGGAIRAAAK